MKHMLFRYLTGLVIAAFIMILPHAISAQSECLASGDIKQMISKLDSGQNAAFNKDLRNELLKMKKEIINRFQNKSREEERANFITRGMIERDSRIDILGQSIEKKRDKDEIRLCEIFKEHGWPTKGMIRSDGGAAMFYLLKNITSFDFQMELVPVIAAAAKKDEVPKNEDFASFLDRLRLYAGLKQLFGTQVSAENGFLVLAPVQSEEKIDEWRKQYNMAPLSGYVKFLEMNYHMPLVIAKDINPPELKKSSVDKTSKESFGNAAQSDLFANQREDDIVRVKTELVNLNVRVLNKDLKTNVGELEQKDFKIFEDGREEAVSFFAKTDTPFDMVLLLDLSGSTAEKQDLIRKASKRFIKAARPIDRIAIVTFTEKPKIISPLTGDRNELLKRAGNIGDNGNSNVWDAIKFTLENIFTEKPPERRRAIIMMSDGIDNALYYTPVKFGSKTSFAELVETVRRSDAIFIPIYLNTEEPCYLSSGKICNDYRRSFEQARSTLSFLAEESGGQMYQAKKFSDLEGAYEQVLSDLSTIYSIGYTPADISSGSSWRSLKVEILNRPDVITKAKKGYYPK